MNRAEQAQKGFKTFLLTMSVSLLVFSVIYYLITNYSSDDFSSGLDDGDTAFMEETREESPFGMLAEQTPDPIVPRQRAVLAAADSTSDEDNTATTVTTPATVSETTQTTTVAPAPDGGVLSITVGFFGSLTAFLLGLFVIQKNPRRLALSGFERKIIKDLD